VTFVLLVGVAVVALAVAGAVAFARQGKRDYDHSNEVVAGTATNAPPSWAGDHAPEAKLHRRLRDAVAALPRDDVNALEARLAIEQLALAVDDQLVTVARLPERVRAEPLAQVTAAVEAVEDGVARVAANELGQHGAAAVEAALQQLQERVELLAQAHQELEEGGPGSSGVS
jgi:hypothetical protein